MMKEYYVNENAQTNGDHEVHTKDCRYLPLQANRKELGQFSTCKEAVAEAKKSYTQSNGCETCCKTCHTS